MRIRTIKKNNAEYIIYAIFAYMIFAAIFLISYDTAADRKNYLRFLADPDSSRFEYGFVQIGKVFSFLQIPPEVSLFIIASFVFFMAAYAVHLSIPNKPLLSGITLLIIVFGISVIYSFMQIRSGFALWWSIVFYLLYLRNKKNLHLFFLVLAPLIHYSSIPFVLIILLNEKIKLKITFLFLASVIGSIVFAVSLPTIIKLAGLSPYYLHYVEDPNMGIRTSLTVFAYFLLLVTVTPFVWNKYKSSKYFISILSIPAVIIAYIMISDLLIKIMFSLITLIWIGYIYLLSKGFKNKVFIEAYYMGLILISIMSIIYSFLRTGIVSF